MLMMMMMWVQASTAQVSPYFSLLGDLDEIEQENEA
jgi:hypothetical protein